MTKHIHCPKCNHEISIETALAERIEAEQNAKFNARLRELEAKERTIEQRNQSIETHVQQLLSQEKAKLVQQLKTQLAQEKDNELKSLQNELNEKSRLISQLKQQEGELLRQKRQLEEAKAGMDAEIEQKLIAEKALLEAQIKEKLSHDNALTIKQKDLIIEQMKAKVEDMQRRIEQGSIQAQGEAQELLIEEVLNNTHRFDTIEEIKKGENGADILQIVRNKVGQECGSILYESKNTKAFSETWLQKLKEDMQLKKADIGIIVTKTMPKGVLNFEQRAENIWICSVEHFKALTFVLRAALLKVDEVRIVQANQGEKSKMLYDYLMGNDFKNQLKAVHDTFAAMHTSLHKEKRVALANFKKREKEIDRIMINLSGIAGSINGISGQTVAEFAEFEVVEEETALLES